MKHIIPVIRLDSKKSIIPAKILNCELIVVRAQELLTKRGILPNYIFYNIKEAGGIHRFLNYNGIVILSFVMKDKLLEKIDVPICCDFIEGLKPDYYTTPDCESYDLELSYSKKQIRKICKRTVELISLCPEYKVIGQIKGCDMNQIIAHLNFLMHLGIKTVMLHIGDFLRHGNRNQIQKAKCYASLIKKKNNVLLLYGFGSQKLLEEFSFADGYITYSHIVNAQKGVIFVGRKRQKYSNINCLHAAIHNLKQMFLNLKESQKQTKLGGKNIKWVEELGHQELAIQKV